jgi:hypothetical protein
MPLIRQEEVYPAAQYPWAQAVEMVANGAVVRHDLVVVNSVAATGSVIPKAIAADSTIAGRRAGVMMIATGAAADGEKFLAVPWVVITGVDTSSATAGGPVYLSTSGEFTKTKPTAAGAVVVPVGSIMAVDAADGIVMLNPGAVSDAGLVKAGQVATTLATATVAIGADFDDGIAVATLGGASSATILHAAVSGGTLTVTLSGVPAASTKINYVVYAAGVAAI